MPIYEYCCSVCGEQIEVIQKFSDEPLTDCPKCGKNTLEKMISPTQFQLKGTGWYVTDFKNKDAKKESTKTEESGSSKEVKSETKSSSDAE